jgi:hypothetical protein
MPSNVGKYDGISDPDDHVNVFVSARGVEQWSEPVWCDMFIHTSIGVARLWFDSLTVNVVDSFDELLKRFMQQLSQ